MVSLVQSLELISLWGRYPAQGLTRNISLRRCRVVLIDYENLLIVRHRSNSVAKFLCLLDYIGQDCVIDQRTDAVVNNDNIVSLHLVFQVVHTIPNALLTGIATRNNPFQFIDIELVGIGP